MSRGKGKLQTFGPESNSKRMSLSREVSFSSAHNSEFFADRKVVIKIESFSESDLVELESESSEFCQTLFC